MTEPESMFDEDLATGPMTDMENRTIRQVLRDYDRARWFRKQGKFWIVWLVGAPVAIWTAYQASHSIYEFIYRLVK